MLIENSSLYYISVKYSYIQCSCTDLDFVGLKITNCISLKHVSLIYNKKFFFFLQIFQLKMKLMKYIYKDRVYTVNY